MNEESQGIFSCKGTSWIAAALLGFVAYLVLRARYDMSFIIALVFGLVLTVLISWALRQYFCAVVEETEGGFAAKSAARAEDRRKFEADRAEAKVAAAEAKAEAAAEKEAAEAQAEALVEEGVHEKAPAVQAEMAAVAETAESGIIEKARATGADGGAKAQPDLPPLAPDGKPQAMEAPRDGGADDLKMIKGVGPKLEKLLNSLGIYHFDQIASWREEEIAWMDENLEGFKGRVSRDEWVEQARVLAAGGTTDFAAKVKKGDVYD